jgi:predicted dehydrogenase
MGCLGLPNVDFVAVADEDPDGLRAAGVRTGATALYADYREMLEREGLDLVCVCPRWLDCHREMVVACAEAGAHIFCEKSLARTLAEADEMLAVCEEHGVKLAIAHVRRLDPPVVRAREMVQAGAIGGAGTEARPYCLRGRGKEDARGGGEDLMVLGTHILDLMRYFAGDVAWAFAHVIADGHELTPADVVDGAEGIGPLAGDSIVAYYAFGNGVCGTFETRRAQPPANRFGLDLYGSEGIIAVRSGGVYYLPRPVLSPTEGATWEEITPPPETKPDGTPFSAEELRYRPMQRMVEDLLAAVEEGREHISSGYDGRASLEMILSVYESQRTGARVPFPMQNREHPLARFGD